MKAVNGEAQHTATPAPAPTPVQPAPLPEPRGATLYERINRVKRDLARVAKTGNNQHFGYAFVTESDIADALRPLMAEHGVCLLYHGPDPDRFKVEDGGETRNGAKKFRYCLWCRYELVNADTPAEREEVWGYGEALDQEDKGHNKAITNAHKYVHLKVFDISTGNPADDPDSSEHMRGGQASGGSRRVNQHPAQAPPRQEPSTNHGGPALMVSRYAAFGAAVGEWTGLPEEDRGNAMRTIVARRGVTKKPAEMTEADWTALLAFVRAMIDAGADWMDWVNPRDGGDGAPLELGGMSPAQARGLEAAARAQEEAMGRTSGMGIAGGAAPVRSQIQEFAAKRARPTSRHPSAEVDAAHERAAAGAPMPDELDQGAGPEATDQSVTETRTPAAASPGARRR